MVEPIKEYFEKLKENYNGYKFIDFENSAISVNGYIEYIYKVDQKYYNKYGNHIPGISSFKREHLINHGVKRHHIISEQVSSISILDLIKKFNILNIDLLYVDAEGYDVNIVLDLLEKSEVRPIIIFEYIHAKYQKLKKLTEVFKYKKYYFFNLNENIICFPQENKPRVNLTFN